MFTIEGLVVEYPGNRIFDALDAYLGPDPVALMGPSGSGKSTLLRVLAGQQPYRGAVELDGIAVVSPRGRIGGDPRVALIHQDYRLVDFLSVNENLMLAAECRGNRMSDSDCTNLLGLVGLGYIKGQRLPNSLSGGEQQRVAIARSLAMGCAALIADEPTGALDSENTERIANLLLNVCAERGVQLVIATHDHSVAALLPRILHIQDGVLSDVIHVS